VAPGSSSIAGSLRSARSSRGKTPRESAGVVSFGLSCANGTGDWTTRTVGLLGVVPARALAGDEIDDSVENGVDVVDIIVIVVVDLELELANVEVAGVELPNVELTDIELVGVELMVVELVAVERAGVVAVAAVVVGVALTDVARIGLVDVVVAGIVLVLSGVADVLAGVVPTWAAFSSSTCVTNKIPLSGQD
jgi:hypothetical protein